MRHHGDPLTLSREDLYELVWSKPITELAKDLGLSDVGLAKRCRKLGVPVPGRGYWARVDAGQQPHRPKLRERKQDAEQRYWDEMNLTFSQPEEKPEAPPDESAARSALRDKLALLQPTSSDLRTATPAVKRTAHYLKRPWRDEIIWNRGERKGPLVSIDVSEALADRALLLAERIISSAAAIGWPYKAAPAPPSGDRRPRRRAQSYQVVEPPEADRGALLVEGELLAIRIDERRDRVPHVETKQEAARMARHEIFFPDRWDFVPAGELRLHLLHSPGADPSKTWKDGARTSLEDQIDAVLPALLDTALQTKADREKSRVAKITREREERLRSELSARRRANATLIEELEAQAGAWCRARMLRCYVRALRRAAGEVVLEAKLQDQAVDFIAWAEHYVEQLDPLSKTPHDPDFQEDRGGYRTSSGTQVSETLSRLLGRHWQDAFKISHDAGAEAPPSPGSFVLGYARQQTPVSQRDAIPGDTSPPGEASRSESASLGGD